MDPKEDKDKTLLENIEAIKTKVSKGIITPDDSKGNTTFRIEDGVDITAEEKAIAWRIAESNGENDIVEKIKGVTSTDTDRFDLAYEFFSSAKENENVLEMDGVKLNPVTDETKGYMIQGLESGIAELAHGNNPEHLLNRLMYIKHIITRAMVKDTYLNMDETRDLCLTITNYEYFGFGRLVNDRKTGQQNDVYTNIDNTLNEMAMVAKKIQEQQE